MQIFRFVETSSGGSDFLPLDIPLPDSRRDDFGHVLALSRAFDGDCMVVQLPAGLDQDWHNAPNRQFVIVLEGQVEVETSSGKIRQWSAGGMFMADDTGGRGHRTRVLAEAATLLFVRVPDDFDLTAWTAEG